MEREQTIEPVAATPLPLRRPESPWRLPLFVTGLALMAASPIIGALPGPGFIIVFPIGLALTLRNSRWAKKQYVGFKRRWPRYGAWTDWGLRRSSASRRAARETGETPATPAARD